MYGTTLIERPAATDRCGAWAGAAARDAGRDRRPGMPPAQLVFIDEPRATRKSYARLWSQLVLKTCGKRKRGGGRGANGNRRTSLATCPEHAKLASKASRSLR